MRGQLLSRLNSVAGQELVKAIEFRVDPKTLAGIRGPEPVTSMDNHVQRNTKFRLNYCPRPRELECRVAACVSGGCRDCVRRLEEAEI